MNPALRKPAAPRALLSAEPSRINATTGDGDCCAVAVSGQAAEPAMTLMNSRRLIAPPEAQDKPIVLGRLYFLKGQAAVARFGSKAHICSATRYVRYGPIADIVGVSCRRHNFYGTYGSISRRICI